MQWFTCQCGKTVWFGNCIEMCASCVICGSGMNPSGVISQPVPHNFSLIETVITDEGEKQVTRCIWCGRTKYEIEKEKK